MCLCFLFLAYSQRSLISPLPQPEHEIEALARCNGLHLVREIARVDHGEAGALRDDSRLPHAKLRSEPAKSPPSVKFTVTLESSTCSDVGSPVSERCCQSAAPSRSGSVAECHRTNAWLLAASTRTPG